MKKKLALICFMLFGSLLGLFACDKNPYANMKITHNLESDYVQMYVEEVYEDGVTKFVCEPVKFRVQVSGAEKDTDLGIVLSGGESFVNTSTQYLGDGVTEVTATLVSEQKTGKFTLNALTKEGNKDLNIFFNIELKINNFNLNSDKLVAVAKSSVIDLTKVEGLISYYPANTDQKKMIYSIAVPNEDGLVDPFYNQGVDYEYEGNFEANPYAEIVDNRYLKVNSTYQDDDGSVHNIPFPQVFKDSLPGGTIIKSDRITLKVQSGYNESLYKYIDIDVVGQCGDDELQIREEVNNEFISINKNNSGVYDVVLLDPQFKAGMFNVSTDYYFTRDLIFKVKDVVGTNYTSEYEVVCDNVLDSQEKPVCVSDLGMGTFNVQSQKSGAYTHKFTIRHSNPKYYGLFDKDIYVKFTVLSVPSKIYVNNQEVKVNSASSDVYTVYNYYKSTSFGTKFKIDMNSSYNYFVYLDNSIDENILNGLQIKTDGDSSSKVLGKLVHNGQDYEVVSSVDGLSMTQFGSKDSFYLSHSVSPLSSEPIQIFVGVAFSMKADSYDKELDGYFKNPILSFPININLENSVKTLAFERQTFDINLLENTYKYSVEEDGSIVEPTQGFKLLTLPEGLSFEKSIKNISYDSDLITVYPYLDETSNVVELYAKCNDQQLEGTTRIYIEAFNGVSATAKVSTYIPTAYVNGSSNPDDAEYMPLAAEVDEFSRGFLYYMTGNNPVNHKAEHFAYGPDGSEITNYTSVSTLFMINNSDQRIDFYDFVITRSQDGSYSSEKVNITDKVSVSFDRSNFAVYSNGVITTKEHLTTSNEGSKDLPIVMTISYQSGYEDIDEFGNSFMSIHTVKHNINLYIYEPLEGVEVETSKATDLYITDSLGYNNKYLASHTIISTYLPSKTNLGANWNASDSWGNGVDWQPVTLDYEYEILLNSPVIKSDGKELIVKSDDSSSQTTIYYSDLFEVIEDYENYQCTVTCRLSKDLNEWLELNYGGDKELFLNTIFKHNIVFTVTIYIRQFNKLQNINSVVFTAKNAEKIGALTLDIDDDGLYFEARKDKNETLIADQNSKSISYSIDNADVINKQLEVILDNKANNAFKVTLIPNATGNSGIIKIDLKTKVNRHPSGKETNDVIPGNYTISVTTQDNIKDIVDGEREYYVSTTPLKLTFSIRIADGSQSSPYEIRSTNDYLAMIQDIKNKNYSYYILTRDLDFNGIAVESIDVPYMEGKIFSLSGKQDYLSLQTSQLVSKYSGIYNMTINRTTSALTNKNVGLFGMLSSSVVIDNINISSAKLNIVDNSNTNNVFNIGILAGKLDGVKVNSCVIKGVITLNRQNFSNILNVGSIAGSIEESLISGYPGNYTGIANSVVNNVDTTINVTKVESESSVDSTVSVSNLNVGGIAGVINGSEISTMQISNLITTEVVSTIGGLVGKISGENSGNIIKKLVASPKIIASLNSFTSKLNGCALIVGGLIGTAESNYTLTENKLVAVDIGTDSAYYFQDRTNIYVYAPNHSVIVGGLVGDNVSKSDDFSYNYLRSYYNSEIGMNKTSETSSYNYYGNIYVDANDGYVGGIIGYNDSDLSMNYSYFDGDIVANEKMNIGTMIGGYNPAHQIDILGCYSIGYLAVIEENGDINLVTAVSHNGVVGGLTYADEIISGTLDWKDILLTAGIALMSSDAEGIDMKQSYAVINNSINYYADYENTSSKIYAFNCLMHEDNMPTGITFADILKRVLGSSNITFGEDANVEDYSWFYYEGLNTVKDKSDNPRIVSYPVIMHNGKVLFDLIPTQIQVKFNNKPGLYDITINDNVAQQVIMYLNKDINTGAVSSYYDIELVTDIDDNSSTSAIQVSLLGSKILTTYINSVNGAFSKDDRIELYEDSLSKIIRIEGNRVYPVSEGSATLTIRSYVVKSLKIDIDIIVVMGLTDFEIYTDDVLMLTEEYKHNGESLGVTYDDNVVYIDELSDFVINNLNGKNFVANNNSGVIIEVINKIEDGNGEILKQSTGIAEIKGTDIKYVDSSDTPVIATTTTFNLQYNDSIINSNVISINSRSFKIEGVLLGTIIFRITPYINIEGSGYTSSVLPLTMGNDIYLLEELSKVYSVEIKSRARSIYSDITNMSITSKNIVENYVELETANVKIIDLDLSLQKANIQFTENIQIKIGDLYTRVLNLEGLNVITYDIIGEDSYSYNLQGISPFDYDFELIKVRFTKIEIKKTDVDVNSRNNTYKITIYYNISFDKDHYRKNANDYNLDALVYSIKYTPTTRVDDGLINSVVYVKFMAREVTSIIPVFYTKGEGKLDSNLPENPEESSSRFIVPGRSGLLKITFDEEFNTTSYVTLTFDLKYLGQIKLYQLSGILYTTESKNDDNFIDDVSEIVDYSRLSDNRIIFVDADGNVMDDNSSNKAVGFGLKLSKLSLNYNDENYFNDTYFVEILLDETINAVSINPIISLVKLTDNKASILLQENKYSLEVVQLPQLTVTVSQGLESGHFNGYIGVGAKRELEITCKNLNKNIAFNIMPVGVDSKYISIVDKDGNQVYSLNYDYISKGNKYYVLLDIEAGADSWGKDITIEFTVMEDIHGILEVIESEITLDIVKFEIAEVKFFGVQDSFSLHHGQSQEISAEIVLVDLYGDETLIDEYIESIQEDIDKFARSISGEQYISYENGKEVVLNEDALKMKFLVRVGKDDLYQDVYIGTYNKFSLTQKNGIFGENLYRKYYELKGTTISNDTSFMFEVNYYYNQETGEISVGEESVDVFTLFDFLTFTVRDNSTYDNPTPIEDAEDFKNACTAVDEYGVGGHYILVNDIDLVNWIPPEEETKFLSLDGNGYAINLKSLNLTDFQGKNSINVGIFRTISKSSTIKNLIINISDLLKTETGMINDISAVKASTKDTYKYSANVDLAYIKEANFGILAGTNNGTVTNVKVVNIGSQNAENKFFHVVTTLGHVNGDIPEIVIGGLVGVNEETGAISNSFVGVNISNQTQNGYYIEKVTTISEQEDNNENDALGLVETKPFILAGANYIGGVVGINKGVISNTYNKGTGIYNTFPDPEKSYTGGFVATNEGVITSSFVEGYELDANGLAKEDVSKMESTGQIGGFVYSNVSTIENSYANIYLRTQSSYIGGFVFTNSGVISNSYSTVVDRDDSLALSEFTGIKGTVLQNSGTYNNCYYIIVDSARKANPKEKAIAIIGKEEISKTTSWVGFSFAIGDNTNGIWTLSGVDTPKIVTTLTDTVSFRKLTDKVTTTSGIRYDYSYSNYMLGTIKNPIVVDKAENLDAFIIDYTHELVNTDGKTEHIFGYSSASTATRYVRIVNNLDFLDVTAKEYNRTYLYKTVFAGVLDGNGMTLSNINLSSESGDLDNFGLFAQIGHEKVSTQAVVKNLNLSYRTFSVSGSRKSGVLAGTIMNSSIINVKISSSGSENNYITAINMAGGLAGLIVNTDSQSVSLIDIVVENIKVQATHNSISGGIISASSIKYNNFNYRYDKFTVDENGSQSTNTYSFEKLYNNGTIITDETIKKVSYAGGIAGVIMANNDLSFDFEASVDNARTKSNGSSIDGLTVRNGLTIVNTENAGGLFGYIAENTRIKNAKFELNVADQSITAKNYGGLIAGENHGVIEKSSVEYDEETQSSYDATLVNDVRTHGSFNIFESSSGSEDQNYYSVALGGIAGYSENGAIIDTYSKANITKSLSFVAGGIIGYSKGNNYLSHVYTTGAVYSANVTGGIIGLQINNCETDDALANKVYMEQVFALNDWNANKEGTSYAKLITKRLYNNYLSIYYNEEKKSYDKFYIKMPEVGNLGILSYDSNNNLDATYIPNHTYNFVGSVVGQFLAISASDAMYGTSESKPMYSAVKQDGSIYVANTYIQESVYNESKNVFSSTLGLRTEKGSINSNIVQRKDEYFEETFTVDSDNESFLSYSYRIAYLDENGAINWYDYITSTEGNNGYLDKFSFAKVFTAQEYVQQIIGDSYYLENKTTSRRTRNLLRYGYNPNSRYDISTETFVDNSDIWIMKGLLPTFTVVSEANEIEIDSREGLIDALTSVTLGKTYRIKDIPVDDYSIDLSTMGKPIQFMSSFGSVLTALDSDNDEDTRPIITINVSADEFSSVFNVISNSLIQNIDFVINIDGSIESNKAVDYMGYGLFANSLDSSIIDNCSITVNIDKFTFQTNNSLAFKAQNVGVMFGEINNSQLINGSVFVLNINERDIVINNSKITNFGMFAGRISNSSIMESSFELSEANIINESSAQVLSIGVLSGYATGVVYSNCSMPQSSNIISITNNCADIDMNISALFGYANKNCIVQKPNSNEDELHSVSLSSVNVNMANIGAVYGKSNANAINNYVLNSNASENIVVNILNASQLNVGGLIGLDVADTKLGQSGLVANRAGIKVEGKAEVMSVGGIAGKVTDSYYFANDVVADCDIEVVNNKLASEEKKIIENEDGESEEVTIYRSAYTYVGGMVGFADDRLGLTNVISGGSINVKIYNLDYNHLDEDWEKKYTRMAVGGMVGYADGSNCITNFVAMNNISVDQDYSIMYVSGVIGLNLGIFTGKYGYSYVQLPRLSSGVTSAVTTGSISRDCAEVFYAQEFVGSNYYTDSNFGSFAMADIFNDNGMSKYTLLYQLTVGYDLDEEIKGIDYIPMEEKVIGSLSMPVPKSLSEFALTRDGVSGSNKFKPNKETLTESTSNIYRVIIETPNSSISEILTNNKEDSVISGRTLENGKVVVTVGGSNLVAENNGVISNIYLNTDERAVVLVGTNNGLITDCYVYGLTKSSSPLANTNNNTGIIYKCATATRYSAEDANNIVYGFVQANKGLISDCYSMSFGYTQSNVNMTELYGFAGDNDGVIQHSYYYIPSIVKQDNFDMGFVDSDPNISAGNIINYSNNDMSPSKLLARKTIWTTENGHAQLIGIKDSYTTMQVKISVDGVAIESVADLKSKIEANNNYSLSYTYDFSSGEKLDYKVIRVSSSSQFTDYINSCDNYVIPSNTIVMFTNNKTNGDQSHIININSGLLHKFSIGVNAALIGINTDDKVASNGRGMIVDFSSNGSKGNMDHEIIGFNNGFIANLTFDELIINKSTVSFSFAPILMNNGTIVDLTIQDVKVSVNVGVEFTSSVVSSNTGLMRNIVSRNCFVSTTNAVYSICVSNSGTITNEKVESFTYLGTYKRAIGNEAL